MNQNARPNARPVWDQRIPNGSLLERQFQMKTPPIILQDFTKSSQQLWLKNTEQPGQLKSPEHSDQSWLNGIYRNNDRYYYNPKDCICPHVQYDLQKFNRIADQAMLRQITEGQLFRNGALFDGRFWNESTSMLMNPAGPVDY
jgi:hypothetical protein